MMRLLVCVLVLLVYVCVGDVGDAEPATTVDTAVLVAEGDTFLKAGKYEEALASFTAAIKQDSANFNTYYKRAGIYLLKGKHKQGLEDLGKVLERNPGFVQARLRRGKVRLTLGQFREAEADLLQVLKDKPDSELAKKQLGDVAQCAKDMSAARDKLDTDPEEAKRIVTQVLEIATDSKEARLFRARVYLKTGQYHAMLEDTMVVIRQDSGNLEALYLRGQAFYYLGEQEAAIKHYSQALKYDPDHSLSKAEFKRLNKLEKTQNSANENVRQNKWEEALQDFTLALQLEPSSEHVTPALWLGMCRCHVGLRQGSLAITACTKATSLDGGLVDAYLLRAEAHLLSDDYDKALQDFHKAREIQPQNQQANEGIHKCQRLQKMAARKDYYKILGVTKQSSDQEIRKAYRGLAKIWHPDKHDNKEEAEKRYVEIAEAYELLSNEEARRRYDNGEDIDVKPNFPQGNPFGHGSPFHFSFNFGG